MNEVIHKVLHNIKGVSIGAILENDTSFGFYHSPTQTEQFGFENFDAALDAWHCLHDEHFENLPR